MAKPETKIRRCAVYTRKSSEDGLEQEFNSLHAQRDACEAFIRSQVGEGWKLIPTAYDDGGISGGTMDRPGLKALMADIAMGVIDTVVVYKVDRLTRSLADFAKMVDIFDRHEVSFVAVTQQFNTTTSMGRLTLNILLSFAQFEREVIGERVRDKIAASKRKGMWMGGMPPLGYDGDGRTLAINPAEAETVRTIFRIYGELESIQKTKRELDRCGIVSKARATQDGRIFGSKPISTGNLHEMLKNPVYIGQIRHKGVCHAGLHEPIIDQALWEETQAKLDRNRQGRKDRRISKNHAPFLNKIFDENGDRLVPTHAQKQGRCYRYYVSHFLINRDPDETRKGWRIPAPALESAVISAIIRLSNDPTALADAWQQSDPLITKFHSFLDAIRSVPILQPLQLLERLEVSSTGLTMTISWESLIKDGPTLTHHVTMVVRQRGIEMRMVLDNEKRAVDPVLLSAVARGRVWFDQLTSGEIKNLSEVAQRENVSSGRVSQLMKLALLSPKIVQAIVSGTQPTNLMTKTFAKIEDLPINWAEQEELLGLTIAAKQA